jgi:FlgD Ig-like domain
VVTATDDRGVASAGERDFFLNRTLVFAAPAEPALTVPRPKPRVVATFKLARTATVTLRIETSSGVLLRTLPKLRAQPGDLQVAWDGVTDGGAVVYSGRYVAELTATNELGSVSLGAGFSVRRTSVFEVAK